MSISNFSRSKYQSQLFIAQPQRGFLLMEVGICLLLMTFLMSIVMRYQIMCLNTYCTIQTLNHAIDAGASLLEYSAFNDNNSSLVSKNSTPILVPITINCPALFLYNQSTVIPARECSVIWQDSNKAQHRVVLIGKDI